MQNHSTCFGCHSTPPSGVLKTVTAASGTGHNIGTATSLQRGPIGPRWREVALPISWPVPGAAVTLFSTPDDGVLWHPKHVEWFYILLHLFGFLLILNYDARNHELKICWTNSWLASRPVGPNFFFNAGIPKIIFLVQRNPYVWKIKQTWKVMYFS